MRPQGIMSTIKKKKKNTTTVDIYFHLLQLIKSFITQNLTGYIGKCN